MTTIRNYALATRLACGFAMVSTLAMMPSLAHAQDETTITGTVVSSSRNTLTLRTAAGQYQLFVLRLAGPRPATLAAGTQVRVTSTAGDDPGVRVATEISGADNQNANQNAGGGAVVPPEVRRVERDIEREARRFQLGVRAGVALDPELIVLGVQAQVGPFFNSNVFFRPSVEFGFGEVTALFSLNPEFIYRLPGSLGRSRWTPYVGVGPGFNFVHQSFAHTDGSGKRIDFGDFHSDVGLNILGGIRYRSGVFTELKTSVYAAPSPTLRLIIGYNF
jgi:hypothetical protein